MQRAGRYGRRGVDMTEKKKARILFGTGLPSLCELHRGEPRGLLSSRVIPQESHLTVAATAAHTYSQNWSRITSISASCRSQERRSGPAQPSRAYFEGDCRSRWRATRVALGTGLSMTPLLARRRALTPGNAFPGTLRLADPHLRPSPEGVFTLPSAANIIRMRSPIDQIKSEHFARFFGGFHAPGS